MRQIKADSVWLAEGGRSSPTDLHIAGGPHLAEEEFLRGEEIAIDDRLNMRTQITFGVWREHATDDAAFQFLIEHLEAAPGKHTIELTGTSSKRSLPDAAVRVTDSYQVGRSTFVRYEIVGGKLRKQQ